MRNDTELGVLGTTRALMYHRPGAMNMSNEGARETCLGKYLIGAV